MLQKMIEMSKTIAANQNHLLMQRNQFNDRELNLKQLICSQTVAESIAGQPSSSAQSQTTRRLSGGRYLSRS